MEKKSKACSIKDCSRKYYGRGYCNTHYSRLFRVRKPLYQLHFDMIRRCYSKQVDSYKYYGYRGIKVCDRWLGDKGLENFSKDMGVKPKGKSLDRIDNDKDYSPENCKWSTPHEQAANRKNNNETVGVTYSKTHKRWEAKLMINRIRVLEKSFKTYREAFEARKAAEIKYKLEYT